MNDVPHNMIGGGSSSSAAPPIAPDPQELQQIETLCHSLFQARNEQERQQAHAMLLPLLDDPTKIDQLQGVLLHSKSEHALVFSTTALMKLITNHWSSVSGLQKEQLTNFMFQYLSTSGPEAYNKSPGVVRPFIRLLCRLLKLAWLEGPLHQDVVPRVESFLENSTGHCIVGLEV